MMYASPIEIKREPQEVNFHKEIKLPEGLLTLEILSQYVAPHETFSISDVEDERYSFMSTTVLNIYGKRLETQEEVDARIVKQEKYMENYRKFHNK